MISPALQGWSHQMGYGSQNLTKIYVRRHLWKFPIQPSAPSRAHHNIKSGSSVPHLVECSISSRTEIPPPLWCLTQGCTALMGKSFLLTYNLSSNLCPGAFCPVTGHLWRESVSVFSVMPVRQQEAVTRIALSCLISTWSKLSFVQVINYLLQNGFSQEYLFKMVKNTLVSSQELATGSVKAGHIFLYVAQGSVLIRIHCGKFLMTIVTIKWCVGMRLGNREVQFSMNGLLQ